MCEGQICFFTVRLFRLERRKLERRRMKICRKAALKIDLQTRVVLAFSFKNYTHEGDEMLLVSILIALKAIASTGLTPFNSRVDRQSSACFHSCLLTKPELLVLSSTVLTPVLTQTKSTTNQQGISRNCMLSKCKNWHRGALQAFIAIQEM